MMVYKHPTGKSIPLMNYQLLATINDHRQITHEAGKIVCIQWDEYQFRLMRSSFSHFARVLEYGSQRPYVGKNHYSVVQVDDELREVWIENTCLSLNHREYRALLNAALRTETRLHGFRAPDQKRQETFNELSTLYRLPRPIQFSWN